MSFHSSLFPPSSVQHSRSSVVPTLWNNIFDREFAQIERMFAPGALWEVMPAASRPFFSPPLPMSGVFDVDQTVDYFKHMRDKFLSDAKSFDLKDSSQGENSLTARYVTKGKDDKGSFDVSHTLFLEFEPMSDKISRGVEYLDSDSMKLHLKRDADKTKWQEVEPAALPLKVGEGVAAVESNGLQNKVEDGAKTGQQA
ncbi:hypothetical protein JCM9279_003137 [Rhodotorula babjevae]